MKRIYIWICVISLTISTRPLSLFSSEKDGGIKEPQTIIFDHPLTDVEEGLIRMGHAAKKSVTAFGVRQVDVGWMPEGDVAEDLAITPDGTRVLVSNKDSDNVTIYTMTDLSYVTTIPVGDFPENIKITPDGQLALVANVFSNSVSVIDIPGESLLTEIPVGEQPVEIEVARDTDHVSYRSGPPPGGSRHLWRSYCSLWRLLRTGKWKRNLSFFRIQGYP
jgi:YVTN family beta-propeller protein